MNQEIGKTEFKYAIRGYNTIEVDEYISTLANEVEELREQEADLYRKLEEARAEIEAYKNSEKAGAKIIEDAKKKADEIIRQAKDRASADIMKTTEQCNQLVSNMMAQVEEQKRLYDITKKETVRFRDALLEQYKEHIHKINIFASAADADKEDGIEAELEELLNPVSAAEVEAVEETEAVEEDEEIKTLENSEEVEDDDSDEFYDDVEEAAAAGNEESEEDNKDNEAVYFETYVKTEDDKNALSFVILGEEEEDEESEEDIEEDEEDEELEEEKEVEETEKAQETATDVDTILANLEELLASVEEKETKEGFEKNTAVEESNTYVEEEKKVEKNSYGFSIGGGVREAYSEELDDDSDEFYTDGALEDKGSYIAREMMGVLEVPPVKNTKPASRRWKVKKSQSLTDEFEAVKYEDE